MKSFLTVFFFFMQVCIIPDRLPPGSSEASGGGFRFKDFSSRTGNDEVYLGEGNLGTPGRVDDQRQGWNVPTDQLVTSSFTFTFDGMQDTGIMWQRNLGSTPTDGSLTYTSDYSGSTPPDTPWNAFRINVGNRGRPADNLSSSTVALRNLVLVAEGRTYDLGDFTTTANSQNFFFVTNIQGLDSGFTITGEAELFLASGETFGQDERSRIEINAINTDVSGDTCEGTIVSPTA